MIILSPILPIGVSLFIGIDSDCFAGLLYMYFSERPPLTTDPAMLAVDGAVDIQGLWVVAGGKEGHVDGSVTRMESICTLPEDRKIPKKRDPRYKIF